MKTLLAVVALVVLSVSVQAGERQVWTFEDMPEGGLPKTWSAMKTGEGPGSEWKVVADKTAPKGPKTLAQVSSEGPRPLFNLCIAKADLYQKVDISVSFKAMKGKIDQGGGPVWRFRDSDNYYVARMNPLEDNYRVYKVEKGKRTQLGTADVKIPAGEWHRIRVVHIGSRIKCYLDDKEYLDVTDETFAEAGQIGLWTKADAVTCFDGLRVEECLRFD